MSTYHPGHTTETALLKVDDDLFLSLNKGNIYELALLVFSSAFDTINHSILVHRPHTDFELSDIFLQWFSSYLNDRTQYVSLSNHCSGFANAHSVVSHGSVFVPTLFSMYLRSLSTIIHSHSITHHSFADIVHICKFALPDKISELLHSMLSCMNYAKDWASANALRINDET